jgi:hypothetical protein
LISIAPAGGPRPLPGTAAGSGGEGSILVSVVAPSDGGGAIAAEVVVAGESRPGREVPAPEVPGIMAATLGEGSVPDTITVAPALIAEAGVVVGAAEEPPVPTVSELPVPAVDWATAEMV